MDLLHCSEYVVQTFDFRQIWDDLSESWNLTNVWKQLGYSLNLIESLQLGYVLYLGDHVEDFVQTLNFGEVWDDLA